MLGKSLSMMEIFLVQLPAQRPSTSWLHIHLGPRVPFRLAATTPVDEEVFAALEYISEIPSVGEEFFHSIGSTRPRTTHRYFQAYLRQARNFFQTAKKLHFRASALMYYYAFLNLAKAYVVTKDLNAVTGRMTHGLTIGKFKPSSFSKQKIYITRTRGVFHSLYKVERGTIPPSNFPLNVVNLLAYSSDIKFEYERANFGHHRLMPARIRLLSHRASRISWPFIAIYMFDLLRPYRKSLSDFFAYFEEVQPDLPNIRMIMDIYAEGYKDYAFIQSKGTYQWLGDDKINLAEIRQDTYKPVEHLYEAPIYDDDNDFKLAMPLRKNLQLLINQPISIYALMFYIGSLVRYHPEYLEQLLQSKNAWIIERFVRGSATTFLRYIGNAILGHDYMFVSR
jgi:hypothetical protein